MKLATNTVEVTSNMVFDETFKVGIADDDEAVAMVIERLISTYKNPYRALLREYTSNAYDEHVQAGVSQPVEVTLPSALTPTLKVQDFGRGLDRDQLKGFGTIGKSDKRKSNLTTGGFGMGSKSALAGSNQFTVISVKDGKRNTVIVQRDENNVPHMNFLKESKTEAPNGTTIIVPIADITKFGDLTNFWLGWKPGTLLVDAEEPKFSVYNTDRFRPVGNGLGWYDLSGTTSGQNVLRVMINQVYYELEYRDMDVTYPQWNILKHYIIKLDNGSVEIAPSRETLLYNARTKEAVAERVTAILSLSAIDFARAVSDAPDIKTAIILREKMKDDGFPVDNVKYNGKGIALPGQLHHGNRVPDSKGTWITPRRDYKAASGWRMDKTWGTLSRREPWSFMNTQKFILIHSAGNPTQYGKYGNRVAHRETFGVGDFLTTLADSRDYYWNVFVTSDSYKEVNRHYRDMADVVMHADEFNAKVKTMRSEAAKLRAKEAKEEASENRYFTYMSGLNYEGVRTGQQSVKDIAENFDYVVFLRNQADGFEGRLRDSLFTKINARKSWNEGVSRLRIKYKVAFIPITKNEKIDEFLPSLPPVVTVTDLALKLIEENQQTVTKWDLMAIRDRADDSVDLFKRLTDDHLRKIKNKETVKWAKSIRDFKDKTGALLNELNWLYHEDKVVREALEANRTYGKRLANLPVSPMKRYPLLRAVYTHSADPVDVVDYINLREKALTKG